MRKLCILPFYFLSILSFAQQPIRIEKDSMIPKLVTIDSTGIFAVSRNTSDTIITDTRSNSIVYCYPDNHESFWYKIKIEQDCEVTFEIFPSGTDNIYNYFLYKYEGDISPAQIKEKKIAPFRANLCKNEMALAGTGISIASAVNFFDASSKTKVQDFYYTRYHAPVKAKKGEVLVLNVYHIKGTDCGYQLTLNSGNHSQKFKTYYKSCYNKEVDISKVKRSIRPAFTINIPHSAQIKKAENVSVQAIEAEAKATFTVRDSVKHLVIDAEVIWTKNKNPNPSIKITGKGTFDVKLEKNKGYHLIFSSTGYKSTEVYFMTNDNPKSFINEVYLSPYRAGDNFVMDKIYFYPNTYKMKPGGNAELDKLVAYLKANPGVQIEIQGHTNGNNRIKASYESDFKGSSKKLSQYRADVIKQYLISKDISADRLIAIGYGGSKMIFPDPDTQAQANKNIRVEVLILSQKENAVSSSSEK